MNINESISALQSISASMNQMPSRIFDSIHQPKSKESLENVFTDMMTDKNAFTANVKALRTMTTVEDILLEELRKQG
jgi:wyosine [tRNA(Phe)-imidazoG37] synthetase (radical SAM superfamily)